MAKHRYRERRQETETNDVSKWYEQCMEYLLHRSGSAVLREPSIDGMTPDLLVNQMDGPDVIIECLVKLKNPEHGKELHEEGSHICGGDIKELHSNLYSRVEEKATKYRQLVGGRPYVVAVYDMSCMSYPSTALALAFSAHAQYLKFSRDGVVIDSGYSDQWSTTERSASLFRLYPHLSGLIYSHWPKDHYFLPNPFADIPVSADLFQFACVPSAPIINGEPAWKERASLVDDDYALPPNTWWGQVERLAQGLAKLINHRR